MPISKNVKSSAMTYNEYTQTQSSHIGKLYFKLHKAHDSISLDLSGLNYWMNTKMKEER